MLFGREEHAKLRIKIDREILVCNIDQATISDLRQFEKLMIACRNNEK